MHCELSLKLSITSHKCFSAFDVIMRKIYCPYDFCDRGLIPAVSKLPSCQLELTPGLFTVGMASGELQLCPSRPDFCLVNITPTIAIGHLI
jgi:hypothetical protein